MAPRIDPLGSIHTYLVPLDGSEACLQALAVTCDIARRTKAKVIALYVIEVPRTMPLESDLQFEVARGEEVLTRAEEVSEDRGIRIRGDLLQARQVGHAIVDEAEELGVGVIVMGVDYTRQYGRFELGSIAEYVLSHATCQVWLLRYEPGDRELPPPELPGTLGHLHPPGHTQRFGEEVTP